MTTRFRFMLLLVAFVVGGAYPVHLLTQEAPPGVIRMPGSRLAGVTFPHADHEDRAECVACHHESLPEKPATSEFAPCISCHTDVAEEPMRTNRRDAFHNARATEGLCVDCHIRETEAGSSPPARCVDCHKEEQDGG
jgi:hypothetical protein